MGVVIGVSFSLSNAILNVTGVRQAHPDNLIKYRIIKIKRTVSLSLSKAIFNVTRVRQAQPDILLEELQGDVNYFFDFKNCSAVIIGISAVLKSFKFLVISILILFSMAV